jgi:hypothetical protein
VPPSDVPMPFAEGSGRCGRDCMDERKARERRWTYAAVGGTAAAAAASYYLWKRSRKETGR